MSVTGWVVTTTALRQEGGTPQLELSVREAVGTTHLTVIPPTDRQGPSGLVRVRVDCLWRPLAYATHSQGTRSKGKVSTRS